MSCCCAVCPCCLSDKNIKPPLSCGSGTQLCLLLLRLQRGVVDTQLIAHDKEVYDIAWGGVGVFASVSADGSVRVFDLR